MEADYSKWLGKDYKYKYVYDFSVKGNETFALFSGIVIHNTLNTLNNIG